MTISMSVQRRCFSVSTYLRPRSLRRLCKGHGQNDFDGSERRVQFPLLPFRGGGPGILIGGRESFKTGRSVCAADLPEIPEWLGGYAGRSMILGRHIGGLDEEFGEGGDGPDV